ncbi:hypothetical protein GCM10007036_35630 [Alsobacter metallidurans]|uniref:DUF924 domain-containing protein n=1 Tax=Alsobacter metallidurans TaxID=340221 RepID=A0A917I8V5_9HYPH|nr:DUF924 family protein [Alsobacter metallidurans]GGH27256.1 hypothetical protein GCM10007036_35630 [Alsobacter metallidurans]
MLSPVPATSILSFWREAGRDRWFAKDDAFDAELRERFEPTRQAAADGQLDAWSETPEGALALVLLLDQLPRNLFRRSPEAFATDEIARHVASAALERGFDRQVDPVLRPFFFLPFMHSEDLAEQDLCVRLYEAAGDEDGAKWAKMHRDIIARFGRFPHRNPVLGRDTTPEEAEFLAGDGFKG